MNRQKEVRVALVGNPNVGKSSIFNLLTGLNQHTGNWAGKTVELAEGRYSFGGGDYRLIDLPGTYSLLAHSREERVSVDSILEDSADVVVVMVDATCLSRGLGLCLTVMAVAKRVVLSVNLIDEAERRGIEIDREALASSLGIDVVLTSARRPKSVAELCKAIEHTSMGEDGERVKKELAQVLDECKQMLTSGVGDDALSRRVIELAEEISEKATRGRVDRRLGILDRLTMGKCLAYPIMLLSLLFIIWLTVVFASYPSGWLSSLFDLLCGVLRSMLDYLGVSPVLVSFLVDGVYTILAEVVAVMLPPMAIFFPLFTLLEDVGLLPRFAYNLDRPLSVVGASGKQALCMCMCLGCNAAGAVGCRIIDSRKERKIALLCSPLIPCNGKFPTILLLSSIFFVHVGTSSTLVSALVLCGAILLGFAASFLASLLLSKILRGESAFFSLELPPFRSPDFGRILLRSFLDRTLSVLLRAVVVAIPAGAVLWLLLYIPVGDANVFSYICTLLDPVGRFLGLDGVLLTAFILGLPANEIVIPIALVGYLGVGVGEALSVGDIASVLQGAGWTPLSAVCCLFFALFHWPCSTTLITIYRESRSVRAVLLSLAIPTLLGVLLCLFSRLVFAIFAI